MWRNIFTGKERRRFVRLPVELKVDFRLDREPDASAWHKGITRDICPDGICLTTDVFSGKEWMDIIEKGLSLSLYIFFPGIKEEKIGAEAEVQRIDVEARVVWHNHENTEEKDTCLLGLHFTRIEKESQEIIRKFIIDNLVKGYHPA